ncbi:MAG: DUF2760 domain-containing protein [Planctomycetota bacterium]
MGLGTALKAFSAALFDRAKSDLIAEVLQAGECRPRLDSVVQEDSPKPAVQESSSADAAADHVSGRSDAVTLLSALQREARLLDLVFEDLANFGDAQVGAAARPCLQQTQATLKRLLGIGPLVDQREGSAVQLDQSASPIRYQRVGTNGGSEGKLVHHGWLADSVDLPEWVGDQDDALVIAPAQIEG